MFTRSSLRAALPLFLGVALIASACGADDTEALDTGIGISVDQSSDDQGSDGSDSDNSDPALEVSEDFVADEAFCAASGRYWTAAGAGPHIDRDSPVEVDMLWALTDSRLDEAIALAPDEKQARPALAAREHFEVVYAALQNENYNLDALEAGDLYREVEPSLKMLLEINELLGAFLIGPCGYTKEGLLAAAEDTGNNVGQLAAEASGGEEAVGSVDGDYSGDYIEVAGSSARLSVQVPIDWEDVQSGPTGNGSVLTVAPDVSEYLSTWRADGLHMSVIDATSPIDWRQPMYETSASSECTLVNSVPYSDALYTGWIDRYDDCGGGPATAVVIGATDEDFSVEILVEVQFDNVDTQNDEATLVQILDTFMAR